MYGTEIIHGWGGMWFGPLFMIGLPILAVLLVLWLFNNASGARGRGEADDDPRRILDARFARGEIDEEEYRRRRDLLGS